MAGGTPLKPAVAGGGFPVPAAAVPVPVALADMVVGGAMVAMVDVRAWWRMTGTVGCAVRGKVPCRDTMGVKAAVRAAASWARAVWSGEGTVGSGSDS